jgi:hypothetical protein
LIGAIRTGVHFQLLASTRRAVGKGRGLVVDERLQAPPEQGHRAGEFLFSPETIAAARNYAELARALPYLRPPRIDDVRDLTATALGFSGWMLPPRLMERLPAWAQQPVAGQVVWKWGMLVASLALALTVLNLFADRPVRIGDLIRFDERHGEGWNPVGRVEAIGLRSTKIRQFDRSLITIPNADLAERNIVNLSACERFLLHQRLALRHETSADQLRWLLVQLRELLHGHPMTIHTADDPIRVRFIGFRDHALSVDLRAYIRTTAYSEFLAIQEDIMLRVMACVKQAGTAFALPAQTLYMTRDNALDTPGRDAAEQSVREWAAAHALPFPDMDEAHRKRITDTLDYPPEGSPSAKRG